jgi:hypothetical protein
MPPAYRRSSDDLGTSILGIIFLTGVIFVGGVWLFVKIVSLAARVISREHYRNRILQVSCGAFGVSCLATLATGGHNAGVDIVLGLSFAILIGVAALIDNSWVAAPAHPVDLDSVMTSPWWDDA